MPAEAAEEPQQQQQSLFERLSGTIIRFMIIYYVIQWFKGSPPLATVEIDTNQGKIQIAGTSTCEWSLNTPVDLYVCLSGLRSDCDFSGTPGLVFEQHGLVFGDWEDAGSAYKSLEIDSPKSVQTNGSLYAHVFITRNKAHPKDKDAMRKNDIVYRSALLTKFMPKKKAAAKRNLITGEHEYTLEKEEEDQPEIIVSYWYPNLTLNVIPDQAPLPMTQIQQIPQLARHVQIIDPVKGRHLPILYVNDFWMLLEDVYDFPINQTVTKLPLHISFNSLSMWKFQLMVQMDHSFSVQKTMMGSSDSEIDNLKRMLFETNPWLLGLTFTVSLFHSLFDFLAFKNDVQFWREQKNLEGLSLRTIMINILFQAIVFLYLFDNETSWLVIVSSGAGLLIECWKVKKALVFEVDRTQRSLYGLLPFKVSFKDRNPRSKLRQETDEYDALAFKYLGIACFPLVIGYSIYSLIYQQHKSWYSWTVNTAVGFVYTFGFITMTPQLFINYKLKSVAHMPWKTFMYKALNTFIDDLFAFIIKMPTLHRLACFRDDIIFLIYLYQRYIYPVDKKRPNEYGQVAKDEDEVAEQVQDEKEKKDK